MKTFIVAEIGSAWRFGKQHKGNACKAISIAKECGAQAVKFQWTGNPREMERRRNVIEGSYEHIAWPQDWIYEFHQACEAVQMTFMCTVFVPSDVCIMDQFVDRWKVASLESGAGDLLRAMKSTGKPVIVSTGAATSREAKRHLGRSLHCTVAYPAPLHALNLRAIQGGHIGYSDHSADVSTGMLAVACGAKILEVHFRTDKTPTDNPDYEHSLSPDDLEEYIRNVRKAEAMLGDGVKKVEECERWAVQHKVKT